MSDNFLSRWSKRKLEAKEQEKQAETLLDLPEQLAATTEVDGSLAAEAVNPELPLPTEADLQAVEKGGDIKASWSNKVSAELKNKAFKALFSRPEFNVMDGLDIYIDDYNKFTPLSQEDIAKMALSKQLLSRPDLELPKIDDIREGFSVLTDTVTEVVENPSPVSDKADGEMLSNEISSETPVDPRVIPNESQVVDSQELPAERSFESSSKK